MPQLNPDEYFQRKLKSLNTAKDASITDAMKRKLADLDAYQQEVAAGRAFLEPDRSIGDIAGDVAVTAAKSIIGLPEGFVGLADIATGGERIQAFECTRRLRMHGNCSGDRQLLQRAAVDGAVPRVPHQWIR